MPQESLQDYVGLSYVSKAWPNEDAGFHWKITFGSNCTWPAQWSQFLNAPPADSWISDSYHRMSRKPSELAAHWSRERQTLRCADNVALLAAWCAPPQKVNFTLSKICNAYSCDLKHIFLVPTQSWHFVRFGEACEMYSPVNSLHLGQLRQQSGKQEQQDCSGEVKKKILSCQNNEICDFSTYWVKDTRSVLSVMLSFWHLGKLHLCRGHKATKHTTSLGHCDSRQSLLSLPVSCFCLHPSLLFCMGVLLEL